MQENRNEHLHIRVARRWKKNLVSASKLSNQTVTQVVEQAVDTYLDEHFNELKEKGNESN